MGLQEEIIFYQQKIPQDYFYPSQGKQILLMLVIESMDYNGLLKEEQYIEGTQLESLVADETCIQQIMRALNVSNLSTNDFLRFLSYLYIKQKRQIFSGSLLSEIIEEINESTSFLSYIKSCFFSQNLANQPHQDAIQARNQHQNNFQVQDQYQDMPHIQNQQQNMIQFQQQQQQKYQQPLLQQQQLPKESMRNNGNPYGSINQIKDFFDTITNDSNYRMMQQSIQSKIQPTQEPQRQYQQQSNYQQQQQQQSYQIQQQQQQQQQFFQQPQQQRQQQQQQQQYLCSSNDVADQNQKEIFEKLSKQYENVQDGISVLSSYQQKWKYIKYDFDIEIIMPSKQFQCSYFSQELNIKPVYSGLFPKKKDAQHDAARKFIPHILFYQQFQRPYFENLDEERGYLENNLVREQKEVDASEEQRQITEDLKLVTNYQEDIIGVNMLVQQHEKNQIQEVLKCDDSQTVGQFYKCVVKFIKNGKQIFLTTGYGSSKKFSKQAAFMKMNPLVNQYYKPDVSIEGLNALHKKPVNIQDLKFRDQLIIDNSKFQVNENEDIDY